MIPTKSQQSKIERVINDSIDSRGIDVALVGTRAESDLVNAIADDVKASGIILPIFWMFVRWWIKRKIRQILEQRF